MSADNPFQSLISRVRAGDTEAAAELVRTYEPAIRRRIRVRLVDERLRRVFDSMDISQSVLASFFEGAALGQFELDKPEQLLKLLATMARNKLASQARKQRTLGRDQRRQEGCGLESRALIDPGSSPSDRLVRKEMVDAVRSRLSPFELQLLELREQGLEWAAIAAQLGGQPEALRKQMARAVKEASRQAGLEDT